MDLFLVAARTAHFAASLSLPGIFAFVCLIAGPAWGDGFAQVGELRRRLLCLAWASLGLVIASGVAWLGAVAAQMSGRPLAAAVSQNVFGVVLLHTRFGEVWLGRMAISALLALCLAAHRLHSRRARATADWAGLGLGMAMLAGLAWEGHGAADPGEGGEVHVAADILHLLAAGVWLGGLVPLAFLLTGLRRAGDPRLAMMAPAAVRRFSALAATSVGILLASGVVNTWFLAGSVPALVGTAYGRLLLLKVALFAAMLSIAAVTMLRLSPRLGAAASVPLARTIGQLRRNALVEAAIGLAVIAVVGILGTLIPGTHTEPLWPFPVRINIGLLSTGAAILLMVLTVASFGAAVVAAAFMAAGRSRHAAIAAGAATLCLTFGWPPLRPAVERAYPTSFYAPTASYAADSIARGAALYAEQCVICHGVGGHGNGPAAAALPIRPADLTEPHLFAHAPGDLFWWISHGKGGVMPGFARVLTQDHRWDLINFVLALAAGDQSRHLGPDVSAAAAYPLPDFAFETDGRQNTLRRLLAAGPVLLVLCGRNAPLARLRQLAAAQQRLVARGLQVLAVSLAAPGDAAAAGPLRAIEVSAAVRALLDLFRSPGDGGETELMLDRNGDVRARWTAAQSSGLPDSGKLIAAAAHAARFAVAAPSHAGHGQ